MKKVSLITLLLGLSLQSEACTFSWTTYGDNTIRSLVAKEIGSHVTEEYCQKFNKNHQIVIEFNAYVLRNMVAGHARVGIRKRGSNVLPVESYASLTTDTNGRTQGAANDEAARATLNAIDDLMSEIRSYKVSE